MLIGSHVGFKKDTQLFGSLEEALSYGENTFMFYTGAPQNIARTPIDEELTSKAHEKMKELGIDSSKVIVHAPYIINLCNEKNFDFSVSFLTEEVKRVDSLGLQYLVLHPGSHVGIGVEKGIENIIKGLNMVFDNTSSSNVVILLETMAGKGSEVGSNFHEIKEIINGVYNKDHATNGAIAVYTFSDGKGGEIVIADANGNGGLETEELFANEILSGIASDLKADASKNIHGSSSSSVNSSALVHQTPLTSEE